MIDIDKELQKFLKEVYFEERYLYSLSDEKLLTLFERYIPNIMSVDINQNISYIIRNDKDGITLLNIIFEIKERCLAYELVFDKFERMFNIKKLKIDKEKISIISNACIGKQCLVKYTKRDYLNKIRNGSFRLKLASSYKNSIYTDAINDDELNIDMTLKGLVIESQTPVKKVMTVKGGRITRSSFDYYISSFSTVLDLKMFLLFPEYDCCLIIENGNEYKDKIIETYSAVHDKKMIKWRSVEYIDPYRQLKSNVPMEFTKIFDYKYQSEYRCAVLEYLGKEECFINIDTDGIIFHELYT